MSKELKLSEDNKVYTGLCGGLAEYFDMNANFIRACFALCIIPSAGMVVALYFIVSWIIDAD